MNATQKTQPVSIRLNVSLDEQLRVAKEKTGLSQADLLRLAAERGLPLVLKRLAKQEPKSAPLPQSAASSVREPAAA